MFSTDIHQWLQANDHPVIYWLMNAISAMGYSYAIMAILMAIVSMVDFRKGFILINMVGWAVIITLFLKETIGLKDPYQVMEEIRNLEFLSDQETIDNRIGKYGVGSFPSGHVAMQTALWLGLSLLERKRWLWIFGSAFIGLTMLSRLYLGHHFLADVIAGFSIGAFGAASVYLLSRWLSIREKRRLTAAHAVFFLAPALLLLFYNKIPMIQVSRLIGLNTGFLALVWSGKLPDVAKSLPGKFGSFIMMAGIYFLIYFAVRDISLQNGDLEKILIQIISNAMAVITGSIAICNLSARR